MSQLLRIKNMVCPRCIAAVQDLLAKHEIPAIQVQLGAIELENPLNEEKLQTLASDLKAAGFELLEDKSAGYIAQIKALIIQEIQQLDRERNSNFSQIISENIQHDYSYLSRLFSTVEGITIERFITKQRVEKIKELLSYGELNLSEISHQMGYSSVAYLSSQFKKETGMTPSEFKKLSHPSRKSLDEI
ncbi:AraC family transcriptional regulator [Algoriphagus vanfongensis]|uniref:AraC family transcriptional regulator n=1 Tax=Algoriphagus vanfongensis TaxID=426371 RepID=UPI00040F3AA1|nr:AraC family transcriptional regulator [Algoriphagus vanfongensis]